LYHHSLWYRHSSQTAVQYAGGDSTSPLRSILTLLGSGRGLHVSRYPSQFVSVL